MSISAKHPRFFLLDTTPTIDDKVITGSRLPTARQVLLCFLAYHDDPGCTKREAANSTVQKVLVFYNKARIPTIKENKLSDEVLKLFDLMQEMLKTPIVRRERDSFKQKLQKFKETLAQTMKCWPQNVMERIKNEEDRAFLRSMMTDRIATMGVVDGILSSTERKKTDRKAAEEERQRNELERQEAENEVHLDIDHDTEDEDTRVEDPTIPETTPKRSHKRVVKTGTAAFFKPDILRSPGVVEVAVRNNITPTAAASFTYALIKAGSGNPARVNLHYKTAYKLVPIFLV